MGNQKQEKTVVDIYIEMLDEKGVNETPVQPTELTNELKKLLEVQKKNNAFRLEG